MKEVAAIGKIDIQTDLSLWIEYIQNKAQKDLGIRQIDSAYSDKRKKISNLSPSGDTNTSRKQNTER